MFFRLAGLVLVLVFFSIITIGPVTVVREMTNLSDVGSCFASVANSAKCPWSPGELGFVSFHVKALSFWAGISILGLFFGFFISLIRLILYKPLLLGGNYHSIPVGFLLSGLTSISVKARRLHWLSLKEHSPTC